MRRLYQQVYLTIIVALAIVVLAAGALWRLSPANKSMRQAFEMAGELVAAALPPASADAETQRKAIQSLAQRLETDLALFDAERHPIAQTGRRTLPSPRERMEEGGWIYGRNGPAWAVALPDGRWIVARAPKTHRRPVIGLVGLLGLTGLTVALAAYPLVRGLTGRLERLQSGVEQLGRGDLKARAKVEGRDEIARLAESFNRSAQRIEELVGAHKMLLANASHELRTPLSRIRLGIELLESDADPRRKANLAQDIQELDSLIEEILLTARLDALGAIEHRESVDLLALAAEEGARYEQCTVDGEPVTVDGDPRLLRRLVRNLLENAARHGAPPIELALRNESGVAVLTVRDHGAGIALAEADRVFEPFRRSRSSPSATGFGLGLALVRQIARGHGGEAALLATPGAASSSTWRITLPLDGKTAPA